MPAQSRPIPPTPSPPPPSPLLLPHIIVHERPVYVVESNSTAQVWEGGRFIMSHKCVCVCVWYPECGYLFPLWGGRVSTPGGYLLFNFSQLLDSRYVYVTESINMA